MRVSGRLYNQRCSFAGWISGIPYYDGFSFQFAKYLKDGK